MNQVQSKEIVERFWMSMQTNDFKAACEFLHDEYVLEWPQSGKRIRGRANFAAFNENYPAHGRWEFTIHRLIAEEHAVVSDVEVTDGVVSSQAIPFSIVQDGKIVHQVEFWPEPFSPPAGRAEWVEKDE